MIQLHKGEIFTDEYAKTSVICISRFVLSDRKIYNKTILPSWLAKNICSA